MMVTCFDCHFGENPLLCYASRMDIFPLLLLVVGGFVGGFFGSAVGSAGLVSLPILLLLGMSPHMAIGTTRPAAAVLEIISALRYRREGVLTSALFRRGLWLGCMGAVGSITGAVLIADVSDQMLRLLLAIVIGSMTVFLGLKKELGLHENPLRQKRFALLAVATLFSGLYAGLFGFTFGTLITMVLVLFGYSFLRGAAMGKVIGILTSTASACVFAWYGQIHWTYSIALSIGFAIGGWMGARAAVRGGNNYVRILLMVVVICSVGKLLFDFMYAL